MSNNGSINDALDKAQRGLLDFFFPRKCPFCGRVAGRELLCEACKASLPRCDKQPGAIRYAPAPSANVPRRCITRAASATPFWPSNSSGASRT